MKKAILLLSLILTHHLFAQDFNYERAWATYYGGANTYLMDDAIDSQGNVYLVGYMQGSAENLNTFVTPNAFQPIFGGGGKDGFIAKFNPDGLLLWATFLGGTNVDVINTIAIDNSDRLFIAGATSSDGMATPNVYREFLTGMQDAFLAEFDTDGQRLWCTYYGGIYIDSFSGMDCDAFDNLYIFGLSSSPENISSTNSFNETFVPNPDILYPPHDYKGFIVNFTKSGARLWGTYYGTNIEDSDSDITGISVNQSGLYVAGHVIDLSPNTYFATTGCHQSSNGNAAGLGFDMFLSKFAFDGTREWSTYYGGNSTDRSYSYGSVYIENCRNVKATQNFVYLSGTTLSNNNIATSGSFQPTKQNHSNFLTKFTDQGTQLWGTYLGNGPSSSTMDGSQYSSLSTDAEGEIFISGSTVFADVASPGSYQPEILFNNFGNVDATDSFVAHISKDGATRLFGTYYGGSNAEYGGNTLTYEDSFYIVGSTKSIESVATAGSHQSNLNGATEFTNLPLNAFIAKFTPTTLNVPEFEKRSVVIYPVPNDGSFTINLNPNYIGATLSVYDMQGKMVHQEIVEAAVQHVKTFGVASGTYLLKLFGANGILYERKIIIN